jgi:hypothetical protein
MMRLIVALMVCSLLLSLIVIIYHLALPLAGSVGILPTITLANGLYDLETYWVPVGLLFSASAAIWLGRARRVTSSWPELLVFAAALALLSLTLPILIPYVWILGGCLIFDGGCI